VALLCVPPIEKRRYPTLGPELCDWIEANLVYGPGPLSGEPYVVEPDFRAQLYRAYEVFPRGHQRAGRRRWKKVAWSQRKGTAKSEKAAIVVAAESHPEAPVRCAGFRRQGSAWVPVGRGVPTEPYIPMVAFTEEQSEDLAYAVLRHILSNSAIADDYDIGLDRVLVLGRHGEEAGKIQALAGSPNARDGARTTFQHFDETHRLTTPRLRNAHTTMQENLYKLVAADAWSLETTTAGDSNEHSVARGTHDHAESVAKGRVKDSALCYIHRFCPDDEKRWPLETSEQVMAALVEASGPCAEWSGDLEALAAHYFEPETDKPYFRRVWLNQWGKGGSHAFDATGWVLLADRCEVPKRTLITLGFDGARTRDATVLVATAVEWGYQWPVKTWQRPPELDPEEPWEVDAEDVDQSVTATWERYRVWRMYCDPPYWDEWVTHWAGRYGKKKVISWWTNRPKPMAEALRRYKQAMDEGSLSHDGDPVMADHIGNAVRRDLTFVDDEGKPLWVISKERPGSPKKIDGAMAGCLSWEARLDAIAAGVLKRRSGATFV